ncbi:MAG TPA: COX15/CtaA family protein, partial [Phycisphaerae bacterium]|nr:COX15/CtaA family protein [Phycisphaerae bacterium]
RRLGWVALAAVILQGVLGGLTVKYLLPAPISVFHACLAQSFFCLTICFAVFTSPFWRSGSGRIETARTLALPHLCIGFIAVVFMQLIFGAIMRHTESGLAVPDFPLAYGQFVPDLSDSSLAKYNYDRRWNWRIDQTTSQQIVYHMLHRVGAVLVAAVVLTAAVIILRRHGSRRTFGLPAAAAIGLLAAQIALGAWTVWSGKSPRITTAHVVVGAALLADGVFLTLMSHRLLSVARREVATDAAWSGVPA